MKTPSKRAILNPTQSNLSSTREAGFSVEQLAKILNATQVGRTDVKIHGIASLGSATPGDLTHLSNVYYRKHLKHTKATAVILARKDADDCPTVALVVDEPYQAYAQISHLFDDQPQESEGVHASVDIHPSASLAENVRIGPFVSIAENTVIGADVSIGSGVHIGANCTVGKGTRLHANVCIYHGVQIGQFCVIHANTVIGADGFGFIPKSNGELQGIAQLGSVKLESHIDIGAGCTIDRGALDDTIIEEGVKIDDQVHIGHNCKVGAHSMLCGCTGLGGSVEIGAHCILAGGVGVAGSGPLSIASKTTIGAMTFVSQSITEPGTYQGATLHTDIKSWRRNAKRFTRLEDVVQRVLKLEKQLATKVRELEK